MRILVTGGNGFIGSHLVEELNKKGHEVTILDKKKGNIPCKQYIEGDICDKETVLRVMEKKNTVFHLAGMLGTHELVTNAILATQVNVIGTLQILEAAKKFNTKVIFASKPNCWLNTYTITKVASENFCLMYHKEFGLNVVIIKWFNVYGARQPLLEYQKAVPTMIIQALKGEPLLVYGSGKQTGDFIFMNDTINATIKASETPACNGRIIEIGSGEETTINELAQLIIQLTKSKSIIQHVPMRRGETEYTEIKANTESMRTLLNFKPKTVLEEGMKKTIAYYEELLKRDSNLQNFSRWDEYKDKGENIKC